MKVLGEIVQTKGNTVIDSLRLVVDRQTGSSREPYLLATFHRLETLNSRKRMKAAVNLLNEATKYHPVKFVTHKPTEKALGKYQLRDKLGPLVEQLPMQPYHRFIDLMQNAETVLADGGSIQEVRHPWKTIDYPPRHNRTPRRHWSFRSVMPAG